MVYKRSEYGQQFKVSSLQKNIPVYKENLTYRYSRRERECSHTPIAWDSELDKDSDPDEKISQDDVNDLPVSDMAIIDEDDESEDDIILQKQKQDVPEKKLVCESQEKDVEITKQSESLRKQARAKLSKFVNKDIEANLDQPVKAKEASEKKSLGKTFAVPQKMDEKAFTKSCKPRRPDRQDKIPRARPKSASAVSRSLDSREGLRKPFVAYGCGDQENVLGEQKTFNVRASSAVYPAALRAQKRNRLAVERKLEKERTASARDKRKKALFNERMTRETLSWVSEYRRCFPAYEDTVYSTSNNDPRKQKSCFTT